MKSKKIISPRNVLGSILLTILVSAAIRDQLSREMMNMTHEQQKAYIKKLLEQGPVKKAA